MGIIKMEAELDKFGRRCYHTTDRSQPGRKSVSFSKASLGTFFFHALKYNAEIHDVYCANAKYPRCFVQVSMSMEPEYKDIFEHESGIGLNNPPTLKLN